ncbi:histidine kinase dimerization/phosphoacceptor domain -containing protein [Roseovarius arcticus]|uniref:histidine kinase dimerization/phosphoacceptor domain -containing protein n=1 Tax=Roseovarius arcticus TaxID=2547404 RepID=UPI00111054B8|nr:histidine kinase dimerization/phosphoacceptor domain -containing protein [Roseovarius arcticus]
MLADKHPKQDLRIATLQSYDVLDSQNEAEFDDIVALASAICECPVSLISLVDDDRQWFKARVGFEPHQTALEKSVCSHAILHGEFLEVADMSSDSRTSSNPLHTGDPNVRFYAGANLIAPNGMAIGTLCVLDTKPRTLSAFQRQALKTLSRQVMTQLELRKKLLQEEALKGEMDHRVKNSLQTIASVMRVASRGIKDREALDVLELVERRISAVASLHSELLGSGGKGLVDARPYLERVVQLLEDVAPEHVRITVSAADVVIDARKASAIGMIVSEFVANSMKHAFPGARQGLVQISLVQSAAREGWTLSCQDDGVGQEQAVGATSSRDDTGLGAVLMSSAAAQLDGHLEYEVTQSGTVLTVKFKH